MNRSGFAKQPQHPRHGNAGAPHDQPSFYTRVRGRLLVVAVSLCLVSSVAGAVDMADEYAKQIKTAEAIGTLGPDIFGDHTNFYTGSTEFSVTDVSLPGNFALPVRIGRRIAVGDMMLNPNTRPFGDWDLDIPYLQGVFSNAGWQSQGTTVNTRCVVNGPAAVPPMATAQGINFSGDEYWSGNTLYVPGQGSQEMLNTLVSNQKPTNDGRTYYWVTNNQWHFSCVTSTANGVLGDAFLAVAPDGTRTQFDWVVSRQAQPVTKPSAAPSGLSAGGASSTSASASASTLTSGGGTITPLVAQTPTLQRKEVRILPTKVTDRFGNYVTYTYDPLKPWRLTKIEGFAANGSADGRRLTLTYNAADAITSVTDDTRIWTYTYSNGYLTSVTLPDASQWKYNFIGITQMMAQATDEPITCEGLGTLYASPATFTATHPSGLQASFTFDAQRHGRSYVTRDCVYTTYPTSGYARYAPWYDVIALKSKTLSGPGMPTATWTYTYGPMNASYADQCASGCPTTKTVEVNGPEGEYTRYTFGNKFFDNEGKLLSTERGSGPTNILSTQTSTYLINAPNQRYRAQVGASPYLKGDRSGEKLNPAIVQSTQQQGATFTWQVNQTNGVYEFDQFANPLNITRSSSGLSIGGTSTTGYSRTEAMTYLDNFDKWVLSQPLTVTCLGNSDCGSGKVMSQTDYDPSLLLPIRTYSFGILQQTLGYNADGTLATVADGAGHTTRAEDWRRGIPQLITYPTFKADGLTPVRESAVVSAIGTLTSGTDELGTTTAYGYDPMGRLTLIDYTDLDPVAWNSTTRSFAPVNAAEYGLPSGHWKQEVQTGNCRASTLYDAQWRPVLVITEDTGNTSSKSFVVTRYDTSGRANFKSYPTDHLTSVADALAGVSTSFDALGRPTETRQDSELGVLTTRIDYLPGFVTRTTNPRSVVGETSYQAFDVPNTDSPAMIVSAKNRAEQQTTTIIRDVFGKPRTITRSGSDGGAP